MNNISKTFAPLLLMLAMSCSKGDDKPEDIATYVIVNNTSGTNLENVLVGYFSDSAGKTILLKKLWDVAANTSSDKVEISNKEVIPQVYLYFHQGASARMVVPAFNLFRHTDNTFDLNDVKVSDAYNVETNGPHYPK